MSRRPQNDAQQGRWGADPNYYDQGQDQWQNGQQQWSQQEPPNAFSQRQQQWAAHDAEQGYHYQSHGQQQPFAYANQHHQQDSSDYYAGEPYYQQQQQAHLHLPSANPPFHSTAPVYAQWREDRNQWPRKQSQHYQYHGYDRRESQDPHHGGKWDDRGEGSSNTPRRSYQTPWQRKVAERSAAWREAESGNSSSQSTPDPSARPVPFARRKKAPRAAGAPPPPTEEYLASTLLPSFPISPSAVENHLPPLLILDLNNTLLCRKRGSTRGSKHPIVRPYLSPFLQYICGASRETGKRRWETAVYSSAASHNVLSLLEAVRLIPLERAHEHEMRRKGQPWDARPGEPLNLVWSREKMNLSAREFTQNVETVKDLSQVWSSMPQWDSKRSVLLDDEAMKAAQHPYSHIPIHPFIIDPSSVRSVSPPPSPRRPPADLPSSRPSSPPPSSAPYTASPTHLPPHHPFYNDTSLLSTIYVLEKLRLQSNFGAWIRKGGLEGLDLQDEQERVEVGRRICEELGIEVVREWEEDWWAKCLKEKVE